MSLTSVDLPEPETPVTTVSRPSGMDTSTSFKLLADAPTIWMDLPLGLRRAGGTSIFAEPDRYCPVSDWGAAAIWAGLPCATRWPPALPAPGPRSTTKSARRMVSSSCSTTSTVLPRLRSCSSEPRSRSLSRACRPMGGSSQAEVAQPDRQKKINALGDFTQRARGDLFLARRKLGNDLVDGRAGRGKGQLGEIGDGRAR